MRPNMSSTMTSMTNPVDVPPLRSANNANRDKKAGNEELRRRRMPRSLAAPTVGRIILWG